jgi:hypothetical protein
MNYIPPVCPYCKKMDNRTLEDLGFKRDGEVRKHICSGCGLVHLTKVQIQCLQYIYTTTKIGE